MRSVQSSLLFLYLVFSVTSVQYCLCQQDSVYSVQCQTIVSAQFTSVQCKQCSESIASVQFLKRSVYRVESVVYIVNGIRCQLGYSLRRSWSAYYYSVVFSLVISCQWGLESIAFSISSVSVAFRVCTVQWVILRLYSSVSVVFRMYTVQWVILRLYSSVSVVFRMCTVQWVILRLYSSVSVVFRM